MIRTDQSLTFSDSLRWNALEISEWRPFTPEALARLTFKPGCRLYLFSHAKEASPFSISCLAKKAAVHRHKNT